MTTTCKSSIMRWFTWEVAIVQFVTHTWSHGSMYNKQLFLSEIVFRFRKDIGSPRRPGFVIYSPWDVSGCGGFVVTCIGYYSKQILPFHFASGEGGTPLYRLYWYEHPQRVLVLEILVRNRVSKWSFWSVPWKGVRIAPPIFFPRVAPPPYGHSALGVESTVVHVWRELVFNGWQLFWKWCFVYAVFDAYISPTIPIKRYKKAILYLFCNIPTLSKDDIMNYLPFTISRIFL